MASSYNNPADDLDTFIDFNGGFDDSNYAPETNQTFSGPSHEYDRFRQQTGLPSGSMANVSAYNDMSMTDGYTSPNGYNSAKSSQMMPGYNSGLSYDMDFEQTPQAPFYPNTDESINPSAVYDAPPPRRMYPGMHSQQAAEQAKAAAMASQQQQSQSFMQQQPSASKGKARAGSQQPTHDAVADRRISEILDHMRHKGAVSPIEEEETQQSSASRTKKEEDEMDEDERLLASEEGKKLSSKERRQLRNKVSARAFRSRRKEYIGQLEGDLARKDQETNELRAFNRKLIAENNQMKNLTRTLLSHPAFGTFMEDMSRNQTFLRGPAPQHLNMPMAEPTMPQQQQQPQQPEIKQEQPEQQPQQSQQGQQQDPIHVNMAHMPDSSLDMSMLNLGANHWGSQNAGFNFQQPSVFAVFDVPQPSIEELKAMRTTSSSSDMVEREQPESAEPEQTIEPASVASSTSRHPSHSATTLSTNFSFAALYNQLDQALSTAHRIDHYDEDSDPQSSTPMPQWSCEWPMVA